MKDPKIIAMYLPQYHEIPENNEFWGKGFTDWVTVKNAKPLYKGHNQPKVPLNDNYYDLSVKENVAWQAKLAKDYSIDGFGIYHYWFNNDKNILTKPAEIILENKDIDIDFFFAWDNASWVRSWSNVAGNSWAPSMEQNKRKPGERIVLIPYEIGKEADWRIHYDSVKPYFEDKRYIRKDGKPLFIIFNYSEQIGKMCICWDRWAKEDGLNGVYFIFRYGEHYNIPEKEHIFKYEPLFSGWNKIPPIYVRAINKLRRIMGIKYGPRKFDYDKVWNSILENTQSSDRTDCYSGAFVTYDDTPRRGLQGTVVKKASAKKFKKYLSQLVDLCKQQEKEFIFLTAWNEWGEGACLEPDTIGKYEYIEMIKQLKNKKE